MNDKKTGLALGAFFAIVLFHIAADECRVARGDEEAAPPSKEEPAAPAPPAVAPIKPEPFSGSRELFLKLGVQASHFRMLMDGEPVDSREQEPIVRLLFAIRRFSLGDIQRWSRGPFVVAEHIETPQEARGEVFLLRGRVKQVTVERPIPEVIDRFELEEYYRCRIELADGGTAEVFALTIPKKWDIAAPLDERVSVPGVFLKWSSTDPAPAGPVFVAQRVAWHPATILGDLDMDVGLYDTVEDRTGFTAADRECFYQLLAAAGRAGKNELLRRTQREPGQDYSVVPLFNNPEKQHGELVALSGAARRIIEVHVTDKDLSERLGISHYYQIEMFTADSQNNPLIVCVRRLPPGMPIGPDVSAEVRIPCFFYKTWSYEQTHLEEDSPLRRQLAPTLVGLEPQWHRPQASVIPLARAIAAGLAVVSIVGVWLAVWKFGRGDKAYRERAIGDRLTKTDDQSLNDLGLEISDKPNFRHLES